MAKKIKLTQGQYAIVDDENYDWLNQWKWYAHNAKNTYYACRMETNKNKRIMVRMHRFILDPKEGEVIDHINGNGLDNRKENIRIVTQRQNCQNQHIKSSSKYPGVHWHKGRQKWRAMLKINNKDVQLGRFDKEYDAFLAYKKALKIRGEKLIGEH